MVSEVNFFKYLFFSVAEIGLRGHIALECMSFSHRVALDDLRLFNSFVYESIISSVWLLLVDRILFTQALVGQNILARYFRMAEGSEGQQSFVRKIFLSLSLSLPVSLTIKSSGSSNLLFCF